MPRLNEPFLGLGYGWNSGENGWGSGYNEMVKILALLASGGVETIQNDPVSSPVSGKAYIVGTTPTGLWSGKANHITYWDTDTSEWLFVAPKAGFEVLVKSRGDKGEWYFYGSSNTWSRAPIVSEAIVAHKVESNAHTPLSVGADPAGTAAQLIQDSAVPFPDVWIPFNDSLRMFAGYGREVKVGDDVVARMVNFDRSTTATYIDKAGVLRTAAINEPRFEKQGLLIEGQSTNIFHLAINNSLSWVSSSLSSAAGSVGAPFDKGFQREVTSSSYSDGSTDRVLADIYNAPLPAVSGKVTISAYIVGDADLIMRSYPEIVTSPTGSDVVTYRQKISNSTVRVIYTSTRDSADTRLSNLQVRWLNKVPTLTIAGFQIESLPFASSYIPTNGTAVTRAADKCWIRNLLNMPQNISKSSFSLQFSLLGIMSDDILRRVLWSEDSGGPFFGVRVKGSDCLAISSRDSVGEANKYTTQSGEHTISFSSSGYAYLDGARSTTNASTYKGSPTADIGIGCASGGITPIYGHVRNLRIWHHALTDAQLRGLK